MQDLIGENLDAALAGISGQVGMRILGVKPPELAVGLGAIAGIVVHGIFRNPESKDAPIHKVGAFVGPLVNFLMTLGMVKLGKLQPTSAFMLATLTTTSICTALRTVRSPDR